MITVLSRKREIRLVLLFGITVIIVAHACVGHPQQDLAAQTSSGTAAAFAVEPSPTPSAWTPAARPTLVETTGATESTSTAAPGSTPASPTPVRPSPSPTTAVATSTPDLTSTATLAPTDPPTHVVASPTVDLGPMLAANDAEWHQLAHDPQRTSYVPTELAATWRLKWIWNGPIGSGDAGPAADHLRLPQGVQPITGDGRLYVGHTDGIVRAISVETGQQIWLSQPLGAAIVSTGAYDPVTNSVYFGARNGKFYQLDATTGAQKRVVDLRGSIEMAPLLAGDTVYVGAKTGTLYALDRATLTQRWSYDAGAELIASPAYSASYSGLIIALAEDKTVHAIQTADGSRRWRVTVNADRDPIRGNTVFADTYPVVSEANGVVIIRSYMDWDKMWEGPFSTNADIRGFLSTHPTYQSFFVLDLADGASRFVAPVLPGAIGNGGDFESVPPQAVVRRLQDGTEVAYLLWRSAQACGSWCDGREDTTLGELNLSTGDIRFVQDYKNQGTMRLPTDEQSPLSMAGNTVFYAHWMTLGSLRITNRSGELGDRYDNPIETDELAPVINTLAAGSCPDRDSSAHYCPQDMYVPGDGYRNDPGFYVYYSSIRIYDQYWETNVRNAVISNNSIYWRTVDGAIIAFQAGAGPSSARKTASPATARTNQTVDFRIDLTGNGALTSVVDELPSQLSHVSSTTTCPGTVIYSSALHTITYDGIPAAGTSCAIQIATRVSTEQREAITNTATIDNPVTLPYTVSAVVILNGLMVYLPLATKGS